MSLVHVLVHVGVILFSLLTKIQCVAASSDHKPRKDPRLATSCLLTFSNLNCWRHSLAKNRSRVSTSPRHAFAPGVQILEQQSLRAVQLPSVGLSRAACPGFWLNLNCFPTSRFTRRVQWMFRLERKARASPGRPSRRTSRMVVIFDDLILPNYFWPSWACSVCVYKRRSGPVTQPSTIVLFFFASDSANSHSRSLSVSHDDRSLTRGCHLAVERRSKLGEDFLEQLS